MLDITLKGLLAHRRRLVGTMLAVVIGVGFLTGTLAVSDTLRANFHNLFTQVDQGVDAVVRSATSVSPGGPGGGGFKQRGLISASVLDQVRSVPDVARAEPEVGGFATILDRNGKPIGGNGPPTLGGNWVADPGLNPYRIAAGRAPQNPGEVVIDSDSASKGKFRVGDTITVDTPEPVSVRVVGIVRFGTQGSALGATFTGFTLADAERYLARAPGLLSGIEVRAKAGVTQDELVARIRTVLPAGVEAISGTTQTNENIDAINNGFVNLLRIFLLVFAGIALLVSTFSIHNTFSILAAQRTRESALLRAVGASRAQVLGAGVAESVVIGLVASVVGILAGIAISIGLKAVFAVFSSSLPTGGLVIRPLTIVAALIVGTAVTAVAGITPAIRASRIPPLAAMRDVAFERVTASRFRVIAGSVVLAIGLVLVLIAVSAGGSNALVPAAIGAVASIIAMVVLGPAVASRASSVIGRPAARLRGITGKLARENAMRNPRRTSGTAAALMVGVGVVTLFTVFAASIKASIDQAIAKTFAGDLVVQPAGFGQTGLSPALAGRIQALPGVQDAVGVGVGLVLINGTGHQVTIVDPSRFLEVFNLQTTQGSLVHLGDHSLALDSSTAASKQLSVGSHLTVAFTDGSTVPFDVGAIYKAAGPQNGWLLTRTAWAPHAQAQDRDFLDLVKVKPGTDLTQTRLAVENLVRPYGAPKVQDRQQYTASLAGQINQILGLVYVMLLLAIVIALLGIGNTLSLSIHERIRELGLLRAVGETQGQVRSMIRWEAVIVAFFGTVGGVGIGTFLGWAIVKAASASQPIGRFAAPVGQLIVLLVLGAVAGLVAGWRPARKAARIDILNALATE